MLSTASVLGKTGKPRHFKQLLLLCAVPEPVLNRLEVRFVHTQRLTPKLFLDETHGSGPPLEAGTPQEVPI